MCLGFLQAARTAEQSLSLVGMALLLLVRTSDDEPGSAHENHTSERSTASECLEGNDLGDNNNAKQTLGFWTFDGSAGYLYADEAL